MGIERRDLPRGVFTLAVRAGNGDICLAHRTERIKFSSTILTDVFVNRHVFSLIIANDANIYMDILILRNILVNGFLSGLMGYKWWF